MQVIPILIGNEHCNFPVIEEFPIKFRLSTNIGDFQNLIELVDILKDIQSLFYSRFSFIRFIYFLSRKDCVTLNELELNLIKVLSREQISSYIRPTSKEEENLESLEERLPIKEIYGLRDSLISVLNYEKNNSYQNVEIKNLTDCSPYANLYQLFSKYFVLYYKIEALLRVMDYEQSKMNVEYAFSEAEMIKSLFLFSFFIIKTDNLIDKLPILSNLDKIKIDLIKEELVLKESDEEIAEMFKNGEFEWFEGEILNRSKNKLAREINQYIIKEYQNLTKNIIDNRETILKMGLLKDRWKDINKTRFKSISFKTNVYNLLFEDKLKPVIYIFDENICSLSLGKYAGQNGSDYSPQNIEKDVFNAINELDQLLKFNLFWIKNTDIEIKIFDKDGVIYKQFKNKEEFQSFFKENNEDLIQLYNHMIENNKLVNILFSDKQEYTHEEIKIFVNFSKKLFKYLENNGNRSSLLRFPDLDLQLNSNSIIILFDNLVVRKEELSKAYPKYFLLIELFFTILLRLYTQGQKWFKLTGTGFREDMYINSLVSILIDHLGLDAVLKIIISIIKIKSRVIDKNSIKRVYIWKYGFLFENLEISPDLIIERIYTLFKGL